MPAPRKFTRERLQAAALALVDAAGLDGLTMRSLATELGTGPMTIYNYVDGRDGLEHLVTEAVMASATWPDPSDDWRADVHAVAEGMWRAVRAHPHAIPLILTRRSFDLPTLRPAEALVRALARSGRSGAELLVAFRTVSAFVAGFAQAELAGPLSRDADSAETADRIAELDHDEFAGLREIAEAAARSDPETEFTDGMRVLLAGLHEKTR
ncbi:MULTISPECIES: TetR/AcrR family transcriptional regulator C-terminal domain-containing protein [Amycolatopsis]|uniref:TetR/AcrR family transcriptional regulator C-terminal domain-containing protein n=1 Tax=Amycolatopsis TaxID=1813 RepID=UPI00106E166A|nr:MULTISPECIES: TetR/AcrR family transcriptional regulator C-terminal domain-containing protein [Amycolatopsis]